MTWRPNIRPLSPNTPTNCTPQSVNGSLRHVHRNASGRHTLVSSEVANENDVLGPDAVSYTHLTLPTILRV